MPDEPAPTEPQTPETSAAPVAQAPQSPAADERLSTLLSSPQAAEAILGIQAQANTQIEQRLGKLEEVLTRLAAPSPPAFPAASSAEQTPDYGALFGTPPAKVRTPEQAPQANPEAIASLVQQAVSTAIAPFQERIAREDEKARTLDAQRPSYTAAAHSLPQLLDPGTEEAKMFDTIYNGMPDLAKLPKAPQIIAEMVRGLSVAQRKDVRQEVERKTQAAADVPRYASVELPDDVSKAKELKAQLVQRGSDRGLDTDELADLLKLQIGTTIAEKQG